MENKKKIYLDDIRTPKEEGWIICRDYSQFVDEVFKIGLENIDTISLDHDLGDTAIKEYFDNVKTNYVINYDNIKEMTGYDCAKWLVEQWLNGSKVLPVKVHSANAIGASNMMGYINNYKHIHRLDQDCVRWEVPYTHLAT